MTRRRSPQEKKKLSLERDRRNTFGENDKASRKNIPRAKARVNRSNRRADSMSLTTARGTAGEDLMSSTADAIEGRRRKLWRKRPDEPLGRWLVQRDRTR